MRSSGRHETGPYCFIGDTFCYVACNSFYTIDGNNIVQPEDKKKNVYSKNTRTNNKKQDSRKNYVAIKVTNMYLLNLERARLMSWSLIFWQNFLFIRRRLKLLLRVALSDISLLPL